MGSARVRANKRKRGEKKKRVAPPLQATKNRVDRYRCWRLRIGYCNIQCHCMVDTRRRLWRLIVLHTLVKDSYYKLMMK